MSRISQMFGRQPTDGQNVWNDSPNGNGYRGLVDGTGRPISSEQPEKYDQFAVPTVITFAGLANTAWHKFMHEKHDLALRKSREDAMAMARDHSITCLLHECYRSVSVLPWHIEVDNEKDPHQRCLKDGLTKLVKDIKRFRSMIFYLCRAKWHGRYGAKLKWGWQDRDMPVPESPLMFMMNPSSFANPSRSSMARRRCLTLMADPGNHPGHVPVNGDKIGHSFNSEPYILIAGGMEHSQLPKGLPADWCTMGRAAPLRGWMRKQFIIHRYTEGVMDADFWEPQEADSINGVGIRSFIFFLDYLKKEWLSNIVDLIERGLGFRIWYYSAGNPKSEAAAKKAAESNIHRTNILIPRFEGERSPPQEGMQWVETQGGIIEVVLRMIQWVESWTERLIVGQSMSGGVLKDKGGSGLGGSNWAELATDSKTDVIESDASGVAETITMDLLDTMKAWTFPEYRDIPARFVFGVERREPEKRLEAAKTIYDMKIPFKADEAREAAGFTKPVPGDEIVNNTEPIVGPMGLPVANPERGGDPEDDAQQDDGFGPQQDDDAMPTPGTNGKPQPSADVSAKFEQSNPANATTWKRTASYDANGYATITTKFNGRGLLDMKSVTQRDSHSCGAADAMAVGRFFGVGPETLPEWKDKLGTSKAKSTSPYAISEYLLGLGLDVGTREGVTIEDLRTCTNAGKAVICCVQDYGTKKNEGEDFLYGHYLVVLAVIGDGHIVCMDSSEENVLVKDNESIQEPGKIVISPETWMEKWHDQDENGKKLEQFGIIVGPRKTISNINSLIAKQEQTDLQKAIAAAEANVDTDATIAKRKSGNYRKGHVTINGLPITIEYPAGSTRSGTSKDGKEWSLVMANSYGYLKRTESDADGDHIDIFIGPNPDSEIVFVIDQKKKDDSFDEHKCLVGWNNAKDAVQGYLDNYEPGWKGFGGIKAMTLDDFKAWIKDGDTSEPTGGEFVKHQDMGQSLAALAQHAMELVPTVADASTLYRCLMAPAQYSIDMDAFLRRLLQSNSPAARQLYDHLLFVLQKYPDLRKDISSGGLASIRK